MFCMFLNGSVIIIYLFSILFDYTNAQMYTKHKHDSECIRVDNIILWVLFISLEITQIPHRDNISSVNLLPSKFFFVWHATRLLK